jgi:hypothetical protein
MMMQVCGSGMMVAGILATILGLGLLASLIDPRLGGDRSPPARVSFGDDEVSRPR